MKLIERMACLVGLHAWILIARRGLIYYRCKRCQHEVLA